MADSTPQASKQQETEKTIAKVGFWATISVMVAGALYGIFGGWKGKKG